MAGEEYGSISTSKEDERDALASTTSSSNITNSIKRMRKEKVPLRDYLWHEHSVLGMTIPDDHVPPPIAAGPCPCCEVDPDSLTRRRRLFIFAFVFFASTTLAVQVSLGHHSGFYAFCATIFVILPLTCHLKENLPHYSGFLITRGIGPFGSQFFPFFLGGIRAEELMLFLAFVFATMKLYADAKEDGVVVLEGVLFVWFLSIVAELCFLVFAYNCGKYCCCCFNCCVPRTYDVESDDDDEEEEVKP